MSSAIQTDKFKPGLLRRVLGLGKTPESVWTAMEWSRSHFYDVAWGRTKLDFADANKLSILIDWPRDELEAAITEARAVNAADRDAERGAKSLRDVASEAARDAAEDEAREHATTVTR